MQTRSRVSILQVCTKNTQECKPPQYTTCLDIGSLVGGVSCSVSAIMPVLLSQGYDISGMNCSHIFSGLAGLKRKRVVGH